MNSFLGTPRDSAAVKAPEHVSCKELKRDVLPDPLLPIKKQEQGSFCNVKSKE